MGLGTPAIVQPAARPVAVVRPPSAKTVAPKKPRAPANQNPDKSLSLLMTKLDLTDPQEALLCLPAGYSDLREVNRMLPDDAESLRQLYALRYTGTLRAFDKSKAPINLNDRFALQFCARVDLDVEDDYGNRAILSDFKGPSIWQYLHWEEGRDVFVACRLVRFGAKLYLKDAEVPPARAIGKIWVKYLGIPGKVTGERVEDLVLSQIDDPDAFRFCTAKLVGALGLREEESLAAIGCTEFASFKAVFLGLHRPATPEEGAASMDVAHRLAAAAVQAAALRSNLRHPHPKSPLAIDSAQIARLAGTQKETLSGDQLRAAQAIVRGLQSPKPLNALLSGDVGTGKTLAYLLPAVAAHRAGAKVAIMAPTSILADQIAKQVAQRFGSEVSGIERVETGGKIKDHTSILVGTTGMTTVCKKAKWEPNLLICDEQHKMSSTMRELMVKPWTHLVEATATPVPRSLASALYGGKEVINIRQCPVDKDIESFVGDVSLRPQFAKMIKWSLDSGMRAAVIYPTVTTIIKKAVLLDPDAPLVVEPKPLTEDQIIHSLVTGAAQLEKAFPGKVAVIHGQMKPDDIRTAMEQVRSGEKPLVVASTVFETGIDIPGITTMVIRNADRFGISALHQLRGRLVRQGGEGWFGMMVEDLEALDPTTLARLEAVAGTTDGYALAEADLVQRGFGDMEGEAQSGSTDSVFRLIHLKPDDFLRKKLSAMAVEGRRVEEEHAPRHERERDGQRGLF